MSERTELKTPEAIYAETKPFDPLSRLPEFEKRYPDSFTLLRLGGIHPTDPMIDLTSPYTGIIQARDFRNIGEHCVAVACCYDIIASALKKAGVISDSEHDQGIHMAIGHDWSKRYEIMGGDARKAGIDVGPYTEKFYQSVADQLIALGTPPYLVEYARVSGRETGHLSFKNFLILEDGIPTIRPEMWLDKLVHLADDMTATSIPLEGQRAQTCFLTIEERMIARDFRRVYPWLWKEGVGYDQASTRFVDVADVTEPRPGLEHPASFAFYQVFIANAICREIKQILEPRSDLPAPQFVKNLVNTTLGSFNPNPPSILKFC